MGELYVPIHLEALVVGKGGIQVADMKPVFWELERKPLGDVAAVKPFDKRVLGRGIHLHWTMPDSLLHTETKENDEELNFKPLPNRWVIQRIENQNGQLIRKAWIVASDVIHEFDPDEEYGNESMSIPLYEKKGDTFVPAGPNGKSYGYLGKCVPCEEYNEDNYEKMQRVELTAVGWGDKEFAAAYQKCASAYGFWDYVTEENATRYTYVVCGYYSEEENDPLHNIQHFDDLEKQFQWSVSDKKEEPMPHHMVCHGAVKGVVWQGVNAESSSGVPSSEVVAAVGNNSAEALAALVEKTNKKGQSMERLLVYHQQDLLKQLQNPTQDTLIQIEEEVHRRQFGDVCAGYHYVLERGQEDETYFIFEDSVYKNLEELNSSQEYADFLTGQLASYSRGLYMFWWLYVTLYDEQEDAEDNEVEKLETAMENCLSQMKNFIQKFENCKEMLAKTKSTIEKNFSELSVIVENKGMRLVKKELERAYEPEPPVILVHGEGIQRSFRQGFQCQENGFLPCRLCTITEVAYEDNGTQKIITAQQIEKSIGGGLGTVPKFCEDIMAETVLLDNEFHGVTVQKNELPFSIAMSDWKQPWNPLEMMWEITFNPICNEEESELTKHFQIGDIDLEWDGTREETKEFIVSGYSLLTPHAAVNLREQTKSLMRNPNNPSDSEKSLLADIEQQDTLSQQLVGFQEAFLRTADNMQIPAYWKKWDENKTGISLEKIQTCIHGMQPSPLFHQDGEYIPVRAGIGKISRLWIVDSFGQIKEVIDWGKEAKVFISESLKVQEQKCFLLPPRILQGCRISARWITATEGLKSAVDPYTSPIHGFVRPDLINKALYLYDRNGVAIGSLETVKGRGHFSPAQETYPDIGDIPDKILRGFALNLSEKEQALAELLDYLTVYLDHLLVSDVCGFYEYCFGKVMVLAEIEIDVKAREDFCYCLKEKSSPPFEVYETDGYENKEFSIKMGDARKETDGLAGFYHQDSMEYFYAADEDAALKAGKYVIGNSEWRHSLSEPAKNFTLLFDPLSVITIRTGFLPAAKLKLKACFYEQQLSNIQTLFPVWPVLTGKEKIELPFAKEGSVDWRWLEKDIDGQTAESKIEKLSQSLFEGAERIAEGYVKREENV